MYPQMKIKMSEITRLTTDKNALEKRVDKEHRDVLMFKQVADESKIPLALAQVEIDNLKKELLSSNRLEAALSKKADKVSRNSLMSSYY